MDTFIDKLAQKRNAQEMILANMTAEAAKMEQMQNQMAAYDELMQEIRQVNLKTAENLVEVQDTLKEYVAKLESIQTDSSRETNSSREADTQQILAQLRELSAESSRNEAALTQLKNLLEDAGKETETQQTLTQIKELLEDTGKETETQQTLTQIKELLEDTGKETETQQTLIQIKELLEDSGSNEETVQALAQTREVLDEKFRQSDDFLHKENVKVYRNVQAAVVEELNKQTEELKKSQKENRGSKAVLPISILILIAVLADIAIHLFSITIPF